MHLDLVIEAFRIGPSEKRSFTKPEQGTAALDQMSNRGPETASPPRRRARRTDTAIALVRLFNLLHVDLYSEAGRSRNLDHATHDPQRFPRQPLSILPNPWVSTAVTFPGAAAATCVNMASDTSK